jgi:hypothetical protein
MTDIDFKDLYPETIIKVKLEIDHVDVILTKDHPDADRLIARWYDDELYIRFEEGKRSLSLDPSEADDILMAFVTAIFQPVDTPRLIELGLLAAKARVGWEPRIRV